MNLFPPSGILAALLVPLVVTSCDRPSNRASADPEWIRLEGKKVELTHKIAVAQLKLERLDRHREAMGGGIADTSFLRTLPELTRQVTALREEHARLESDVPALENSLAEARRSDLEAIRSKAVGLQFVKLETRTGSAYEQAKVISIDDTGVKISHASGVARLGSEDLDSAQCRLFGVDRELELAANQSHHEKEEAYYREVDSQLAAQNVVKQQRDEQARILAANAPRVYETSYTPPQVSAFDRPVTLRPTTYFNSYYDRYPRYNRIRYYDVYTPSYSSRNYGYSSSYATYRNSPRSGGSSGSGCYSVPSAPRHRLPPSPASPTTTPTP